MHVLVIGAGALGSPVAEQLAKAGVGYLYIVDPDHLSSANIGRHVLGANSLGQSKAVRLASSISERWPSCVATGFNQSIGDWLTQSSIQKMDAVLDLTGEPNVRLRIDQERSCVPVSLVVAWMEPFVAAAHVCLLPPGSPWVIDSYDSLERLNAVDWPAEVMQKEPACSSEFQSYTSAAAAHAVALTSEAALDALDDKISEPTLRHWIRGQRYLDRCHPALRLREWAMSAAPYDGLIVEEAYGWKALRTTR